MNPLYEPVLEILRSANDGHEIEFHERNLVEALDALSNESDAYDRGYKQAAGDWVERVHGVEKERDELRAPLARLGRALKGLGEHGYGAPNYSGERHAAAHAEYEAANAAVVALAESLAV